MESNLKLVSTIMPVYNAERYVAFAIESVVSQTYRKWELIIVDDGSTDSSFSVIEPYLVDPRVRYFKKPNGGQASARNLGLSYAKGELVAFLDADDGWVENKLELQVKFLMDHPRADLTYSKAYAMDARGEKKMELNLVPKIGTWNGRKGFEDFVRGRFFIPILTVMARKAVINSKVTFYEGREIQGAEDFDLWAKLLVNGACIIGMDHYLAFYRIHAGQITSQDSSATEQVIVSLRQLKSQCPSLSIPVDMAILIRLLDLVRRSNHKCTFLQVYTENVAIHKIMIWLFGQPTYITILIKLLRLRQSIGL